MIIVRGDSGTGCRVAVKGAQGDSDVFATILMERQLSSNYQNWEKRSSIGGKWDIVSRRRSQRGQDRNRCNGGTGWCDKQEQPAELENSATKWYNQLDLLKFKGL